MVKQLEGGLTNTSYLIEAGSKRAVLRINNLEADKLGVNRQNEITILKKLQCTDFVPRFYYSDRRILVTEYIDGYAFDADKALKSDTKKQLIKAIEDIQSIDLPDLNVLNYELYIRDYCNQLSPQYLDKTIKQALLKIARTIDTQDWHPVLCHHDLIPENIIQSKNGIFIIDWEYASIGHPQFDYLRLINSHQIMDIPDNEFSLQALQAIMVQLWYVIRYPELQETVKEALIKIIERVNLE
ncbi:MAG: phosphotransferase [Porticoccaceae bacterium]